MPWFKIKTSIFTDTSKLDSVTKMHPKEIVYKAIPYKIHVLKLLSAGLSVGNVRWDKLVRKNYDFIYTGDNVDVQNLRIFYKSAYYMRNVRGDDKDINETGLKRVVGQATNIVFGQEDYPEPLLPLRAYPSNIKGRPIHLHKCSVDLPVCPVLSSSCPPWDWSGSRRSPGYVPACPGLSRPC